MVQTDEFTIRRMAPDDRSEVKRVAYRSFPFLVRAFFGLSPDTFLAEADGRVLGGIVLRLLRLPGGRKGGYVAWVFTDPEARGRGVAQGLIGQALAFFEGEGCDEVLAAVDGYNPSSSKLWVARGFAILSLEQQLHRYGLQLFLVWVRMFHLFDIGHFLWALPGEDAPVRPLREWLINSVLVALLFVLAFLRIGVASLQPFLAGAVVLVALLGLRTLIGRWAAERQGLSVHYRMWDSGLVLSGLVALVFGGILVSMGNVYPTVVRWRLADKRARLGRMAVASVLPAIVVTWILWAVLRLGGLPQNLGSFTGAALWVVSRVAFYDTALPFFPFVAYNGRLIWQWNRLVWVPLAIAAVLPMFV